MKKIYSAPKMVQVRMEAETPVMQTSGATTGNLASFSWKK